jgi:CRP/FNR family nitrogen fixation transcriptional regulator
MPAAQSGAPFAAAPSPPIVEGSGTWASFGVHGTVITLARDEPLFCEDDVADRYFEVLSGAVRSCTLLFDGRRHVGDFFLPGDFVGFGAVGHHEYRAEAVTEAQVSVYARHVVDLAVGERPLLGRWLLSRACEELAAAERHKLLLGRKTAPERIASFLIDLVRRRAGNDRVRLPMTRIDIGDHLGLTTETVSRVLSQLRTDGVIALYGVNELHILDWDALLGFAGDL